jgi:uncharacterized heparinase superfamily protein
MPDVLPKLPGRFVPLALAIAVRRRFAAEWTALNPQRWLPSPSDLGLGGSPRDLRPADAENGARLLAGNVRLAGIGQAYGQRAEIWDRPAPSRGFAVALHRMAWLPDLLAAGRPGAAEALRLVLAWRRQFGTPGRFGWTPEVLERRVFNLACGLRVICAGASEAETAALTRSLLLQARRLLAGEDGRPRAAERAACAAVAAAALSGRSARRLQARALGRLARALPATVKPDGGHASRSPQAGLELLFDLLTLDEALTERGQAAPPAMMQAIDRLLGAVRFFTLGDGRLPALQGGEPSTGPYVAAARAEDEWADRPAPAALGGYQRLGAPKALEIVADAAAAPQGQWSVSACAQPLALEILAGGRPLIGGQGWSPDAAAPPGLRMVEAASTLTLGDQGCGAPVRGYSASVLGPRLRDVGYDVRAARREAEGAVWLDMTHDGWADRYGLRCERRLYLDAAAEELRAEDRFTALGEQGRKRRDGGHFAPYAIRFHLHPGVSALAARDGKSVLLKADGRDQGWLLRTDAQDLHLEPSLRYGGGGAPRRSQQIILRGQVRIAQGARVRWKLSRAEPQR